MTEPAPIPETATAAEHAPVSPADTPQATGTTPDSDSVAANADGTPNADSGTAADRNTEAQDQGDDEEADKPLGQRLAREAVESRMREESLRTYVHTSHHVEGGVLLRTRTGNITIRDINIGLERSGTIKPDLVGARLASEIKNTFVPTPSYEKLVRQLRDDEVVVLKGPANSGRFWTALAALAMWVAEKPELRSHGWLDGVEDPRRIEAAWLDKHTGYVIDATDEEWVRRGRDAAIRHLRGIAETLQGRFVILTGPDGLPGCPEIAHEPPDPREVFESRLIWHLQQRGHECTQSTLQALADIASEHRLPRESDDLAMQAADFLAGGGRAEDFSSGLPDALRKLAKELLQEDSTLHRRCFLISLAVLNELPLVTVSRAATLLLERLAPPNSVPEAAASPSWEWLPEWLESAQAERLVRESVTRVRFRRPRLAGAILEVAWQDGESIREAILDWLKLLAQRKDRQDWEVRLKVAHAIGRIAAFDFKLIEAEFLNQWVGTRRQNDSWLAAWTLEAAYAADPSQQVLDCLARWVRTATARRTAARAYGSLIGRERIAEALWAFRTMVRQSTRWNRYLHDSVGRALTEVYHLTTASAILKELARWSEDDHPGLRRTAALALTRLAMRKGATPDRLQLDDLETESWPFTERRLAKAWINALSYGLSSAAQEHGVAPPVSETWEALASWLADWDDSSDRYRSVVERVFTTRPAVLHGPLRLHLCHWYHNRIASADLCRHLHQLMEGGSG